MFGQNVALMVTLMVEMHSTLGWKNYAECLFYWWWSQHVRDWTSVSICWSVLSFHCRVQNKLRAGIVQRPNIVQLICSLLCSISLELLRSLVFLRSEYQAELIRASHHINCSFAQFRCLNLLTSKHPSLPQSFLVLLWPTSRYNTTILPPTTTIANQLHRELKIHAKGYCRYC